MTNVKNILEYLQYFEGINDIFTEISKKKKSLKPLCTFHYYCIANENEVEGKRYLPNHFGRTILGENLGWIVLLKKQMIEVGSLFHENEVG